MSLLVAGWLGTTSGAQAEAVVPPAGWQSTQARSHPLVGQIYDTATSTLLDKAGFTKRLASRDTVLLGEVHDNPDHHALRAGLLEGRRGVVLEHLRAGQQQELDRMAAVRAGGVSMTGAAVLDRLAWSQSGWPDARLFEPLFDAILAGRHVIYAGDVERSRIRDVARSGPSALPPEELSRLHLDRPLPAALEAALLDELEASHCGLMPRTAFKNMLVAQRYRDAHLADVVRKALAAGGGVTLLAGNGHVRSDRAVPWYLAQADATVRPLAVMILEVADDKTTPAAYLERGPDGQPVADILLFTPRAERPDPCEEMRRSFTKRQ